MSPISDKKRLQFAWENTSIPQELSIGSPHSLEEGLVFAKLLARFRIVDANAKSVNRLGPSSAATPLPEPGACIALRLFKSHVSAHKVETETKQIASKAFVARVSRLERISTVRRESEIITFFY